MAATEGWCHPGTGLLTSLGKEAVALGLVSASAGHHKACPHSTLALCPHRVYFKSSHHTEKGMSWGEKMPRPFRAQVQSSRTNLKCHLGHFHSQPAKTWFIYIVSCGWRPKTLPCQGVRDGQLGAPAVAPWPGLCSEPPSGNPCRQKCRPNRPNACHPHYRQCSLLSGPQVRTGTSSDCLGTSSVPGSLLHA